MCRLYLFHNLTRCGRVNLNYLSVIGNKAVRFVLNVGQLCVNERRCATLCKGKNLVKIKVEKCALEFLARLKEAVAVILFGC